MANLKRAMVTRAVRPRMFGFFTTLSSGALRRNRSVPTALETTAKITQGQGRFVIHMRSAISHAWSGTQPKLEREVRQCWRRCVGCCVVKKKKRCYVCDGSKKKNDVCQAHEFPRRLVFAITVLINANILSVSKRKTTKTLSRI